MRMTNPLVPVRKSEIEIGKPLPWAVYDGDRNLLLNKGVVVTTMHQVEVLSEKGLYRERVRPATPATAVVPEDDRDADEGGEVEIALEDIRLSPGDTLQLQPLVEGQSVRYPVRLVGLMRGKSLLVTAPEIDGKFILVREAQPFLIRVFSGLNVCAFKAKVLKTQHSPFPYVHLSYPDVVKSMRLRKAMRAQVRIIAAIHDAETGVQIAAARIADISVGGARILAADAFGDPGRKVSMAFKVKLDEIEEYLTTQAVIRSNTDSVDENGAPAVAVGVQFVELEPQQKLVLMSLLYQQLHKE